MVLSYNGASAILASWLLTLWNLFSYDQLVLTTRESDCGLAKREVVGGTRRSRRYLVVSYHIWFGATLDQTIA